MTYKESFYNENEIGGLYSIHNSINNKFYIGSTNNFRKRWNVHKTLLRKNKHHSPHLQAAWNKYGEETFRFLRIQFIDSKEDRLFLEQHFLDTLKPPYNVSIFM